MAQDTLKVGVPVATGTSVLTRRIELGAFGQVLMIILKMIAVTLALALALATAPMIWGWYPVVGHSMEPTIPFLGGYFKLGPTDNLGVNDIVALRSNALGYAVKRIAKIDFHKGVYVLGDNTDHSADSSFGLDGKEHWIPFAEVKGKATDLWSPVRSWRSRSKNGRFQNWLELSFTPLQYQWSPTGEYVALRLGEKTDIMCKSSDTVLTMRRRFKMWLDEKSLVIVSGTDVDRVTVPDGTATPWAITPTMLGMGFQQSGVITIDGPADVVAGDIIEFRSHPEIHGQVKAVSRDGRGGMWGLVTVVELDPPLPFHPQFGETIKVRRA